MSRFIFLIVLATSILTPEILNSQIIDRVWYVGEEQIEGKLRKLGDKSVDLKTMDGEYRTVLVEELSEKDQKYLSVSCREVVDRDRQQFDLVSKHFVSYLADPKTAVEELKKLEGSPVRSPYASMMIGVAKALQEGDHVKAGKYFGKATKAIKISRIFLGDQYQESAFESLLNNSGVVAIKKHKGDTAAKLFKQCVSHNETPFSVHHNAKLLLIVASKRLNVELKSKGKRDLTQLIAIEPESSTSISSMAAYFVYDLNWDSPLSEVQLHNYLSGNGLPTFPLSQQGQKQAEDPPKFGDGSTALRQQLLFPDLWCTACRGKGAYSCNAKNCLRGKVMRKVKKISRIGPNGRPMYFDDWVVDHKCRKCGGDDSLKCPHCNAGRLPHLK